MARLALEGEDLRWRRTQLAAICNDVIDKHGFEIADSVFQVVHIHKTEELFTTIARENRLGWKQLTDDAKQLRPQLKRKLQDARRLHVESTRQKWYGISDVAKRTYECSAWTRARATYERALTALEHDPLFAFLLQRPIAQAPRGNPAKTRNRRLRTDLTGLGLSRRQVTNVSAAIGFTRPRGG